MNEIIITEEGDVFCPFCTTLCPAPTNDDNHYCPVCGALYLEEDEACLSDSRDRAKEHFVTDELEIIRKWHDTEYNNEADLAAGDPTVGHKIYLQFFRPAAPDEPARA